MPSMYPTRREFIASISAVAALSAVPRVFAAPAAQGIIDTHIHVWDLKQLNPPWLATAPEVLRKPFMVEQYREATAGLGIEQAVYVEIAEAPERRRAEAQFVTSLVAARGGPIQAAVIAGDPAAEGFADFIRQFQKTTAIRGIRFRYEPGAEKDPRFLAGVRLLGELGLSYDLVMGADRLASAAALVASCPGTRFIMDHCAYGNPDWYNPLDQADAALAAQRKAWEEGIARLAENANVACKISGIAEQSRRPISPESLAPVVDYCVGRFGEDRVLFGSNWPVCLRAMTLADWLAALKKITAARGEAFQRKLLHGNASKWYRLG